jgi:hypothetical protein
VELRYLYVGSTDTERDLDAWLRLPEAKLRWRFQHFGADVGAVDLGSRPFMLIADHRPAGSVLPIFAVDDLDAVADDLVGHGWSRELGPMGTPEGPACVLHNESGAAIALLQVDRPEAMEAAYSDAGNTHAVRMPA